MLAADDAGMFPLLLYSDNDGVDGNSVAAAVVAAAGAGVLAGDAPLAADAEPVSHGDHRPRPRRPLPDS